jgi:N-carbamoylputrescine amidase
MEEATVAGQALKVAAIQMDCSPAPVPERLARAADLIAEAANAGAQLTVLPELFNTGYEWHDRNYALAEPMDGQTVTWMKAQAAHHNIHLAGSLLLLDKADIYNAAPLVAPDGRLWRYDKYYVPLWERAYTRNGDRITIAHTDLGNLGMMICWDQMHPELWTQYAGKVDAMVVMSCPGDLATADLLFPDGDQAKFVELGGDQFAPTASPADSAPDEDDPIDKQAAWLGVPLVHASATGTIHTKVPLFEALMAQSPLADRADQASETILECGFPPATRIVDAMGKVLARGSATGDGLVIAEVAFPDLLPTPEGPQPDFSMPEQIYHLSDETIPAMMVPLYKEGVRRQWGVHMAPD